PADFDPREYARRAEWQFGDEQGVGEILISERIAWQIERHFGRFGEIRPAAGEVAGAGDGDRIFATAYASPRMLVSWVLGLGEHARILGPPELAEEVQRRLALLHERHSGDPALARPRPPRAAAAERTRSRSRRGSGDDAQETAIRPERFARLVTL